MIARVSRSHLLAAGAAACVASGVAAVLFYPSSAQASTWTPGASQTRLANAAAHRQASSTIPGVSGEPILAAPTPTGSWPANVSGVAYVGMSRAAAERYVDDSSMKIADGRSVVLIRMTGRFSVVTKGPAGSPGFATGTVLTVVIDARTGNTLDFGLDNAGRPLPSTAKTELSR